MNPGFKVTDEGGSITSPVVGSRVAPTLIRKPFSSSSSLAAIPAADRSGESGGGVTNGNRAAPAPFTDDLLMDKAQLKRFMQGPVVHSRDLNEREIGKDERDWVTFSWRDSAWLQGGIWIGAVIGLAVAFGLVLLLIFDWS